MEKNITLSEMSMNVYGQRKEIADKSVKLGNDIYNYLKLYFARTNKEKIELEKPYILSISTIHTIKYKIHSIEFDGIDIILNCSDSFGVLKNVKLSALNPFEQAMLFDFIVAEISKNTAYVVLEEKYTDQIKVAVVGTFRRIEKAEECLKMRIEHQQTKHPYIWKDAKVDKNDKHEYYVCGNNYYYTIKIVEQEIND